MKKFMSILLALLISMVLIQSNQVIASTSKTNQNKDTKIKTYKFGNEITLKGKLYKEKWIHPNGSTQYAYILKLDKAANFITHKPFDSGTKIHKNVKEIQIGTDDGKIMYKKSGQRFKIKGNIDCPAGTIYYRRKVVLYTLYSWERL